MEARRLDWAQHAHGSYIMAKGGLHAILAVVRPAQPWREKRRSPKQFASNIAARTDVRGFIGPLTRSLLESATKGRRGYVSFLLYVTGYSEAFWVFVWGVTWSLGLNNAGGVGYGVVAGQICQT